MTPTMHETKVSKQRDELLRALEAVKEDLENNGEVFGSDAKRIAFIEEAIARAAVEES